MPHINVRNNLPPWPPTQRTRPPGEEDESWPDPVGKAMPERHLKEAHPMGLRYWWSIPLGLRYWWSIPPWWCFLLFIARLPKYNTSWEVSTSGGRIHRPPQVKTNRFLTKPVYLGIQRGHGRFPICRWPCTTMYHKRRFHHRFFIVTLDLPEVALLGSACIENPNHLRSSQPDRQWNDLSLAFFFPAVRLISRLKYQAFHGFYRF